MILGIDWPHILFSERACINFENLIKLLEKTNIEKLSFNHIDFLVFPLLWMLITYKSHLCKLNCEI